MIKISEQAAKKVVELMNEAGLDTEVSYLRVGVSGSGCAGLSYKMDFDEKNNEGDQIFEQNGIKIICDKKSLIYLLGTELTYSSGLNGKGFEWSNPNAGRVCGCGNSFSV